MTTASPDPVGFAYHRMARRTGRHRWWRPLLSTALFLPSWLLLILLLYAFSYAIGTAAGYPELPDGGVDLGPLRNTALDLMYIAITLPLILLAVRWTERRPAGTLSSVTGRLRFRWLAWCLLAALLPVTLLALTTVLLPDDGSSSGEPAAWVGVRSFLVSLAVLAVFVPVQAAAEEYVFRGWLIQAAGAFLRSPWFAVLPQAGLFASAHGWGTTWGFIDLLLFGLVAGWLTIRTGGLEATIALHTLNNLLAFGVSAAVVDGLSSDDTAADAPWQLALADMAIVLLYATIILRVARRHRPQRLAPEVAPPPAPPVPNLYPQPLVTPPPASMPRSYNAAAEWGGPSRTEVQESDL
ncbi:CPBP family intramembrane glutamic endopeptidase [Streptomyces coeruleorubidus]|uniref:CPBP family intramembrane glutamic endopeptidase n=1 Tax=Streptomyces coeruleorubidus TaxID=116188 RepID=A0ABZ0KRJ9_STRC4|nr:CPBP family intramembrane glutamic endopeptidase [Streptomyces coeruleorubidus]WOT40608.1 CPBP family intramembrane glutamic endopeptidase [Streptomyces coeruleorubidus]